MTQLYYLAGELNPSPHGFRVSGLQLFRCSTVKPFDVQLIQAPTPSQINNTSLDDTQPVICRNQIYFTEHTQLCRTRADGSGGHQAISTGAAIYGGNQDRIWASPGGEYVFVEGEDATFRRSILRVSTKDDQVRKIWPAEGTSLASPNIQAVSEQLVFFGSRGTWKTIDFEGREFDLRKPSLPETALHCDCDLCGNVVRTSTTSSHEVTDLLVFEEGLFGTVVLRSVRGSAIQGSYQLVRGEIPTKLKPESKIKFRFLCDGLRVTGASRAGGAW